MFVRVSILQALGTRRHAADESKPFATVELKSSYMIEHNPTKRTIDHRFQESDAYDCDDNK